jgi:hypothetical protein
MLNRATATINDTILLEYRLTVNGALRDVDAWTRIEIYAVDPRQFPAALPIQTILPTDITRAATGVYSYVMSAVAASGAYFDKQLFRLNLNGTLADYTDIETTLVRQTAGTVVPPIYQRIGYTFKNYTVPADEWGEVLTADDLRYTQLFGNTLKGTDGWEASNEQLESCVEWAVERVEIELGIDIRRRKYKCNLDEDLSSAVRKPRFVKGIKLSAVGYTDLDAAYEFRPQDWNNFGFMQLRHYPVISVERVNLYSPLKQFLMSVTEWLRVDRDAGQLGIYPTLNNLGFAPLYGQSPFWSYMRTVQYPSAFYVDYTTGYETSDYVPEIIRDIVARIACISLLQWVGDGLLAGFSSSSISLDGISESFSSTQSATSAYFGARILSLQGEVKELMKECRHKFSNIPIAFA